MFAVITVGICEQVKTKTFLKPLDKLKILWYNILVLKGQEGMIKIVRN